MANIQDELFKSKVCKKLFSKASYRKQHMHIQSIIKPHTCEECQKQFTRARYLRQHMLTHSVPDKPYQCEECRKQFTRARYFRQHMLTHSVPNKLYQCEECEKRFMRASHLKDHMLIHSDEKPHRCKVCQKQFSQARHLKQHMHIHSGIKPHKCEVCEKLFSHACNLKQHMLTHTGEKPHQCEVCQKQFSLAGQLKQHMVTHTGIKPHKCEVCKKQFSQSSTLKRHMLSHTGIKPHQCDLCQKQFTRYTYLKKHMLIHSGNTRHQCAIHTETVFQDTKYIKVEPYQDYVYKTSTPVMSIKTNLHEIDNHEIMIPDDKHDSFNFHSDDQCKLEEQCVFSSEVKPHKCEVCEGMPPHLPEFKTPAVKLGAQKLHCEDQCKPKLHCKLSSYVKSEVRSEIKIETVCQDANHVKAESDQDYVNKTSIQGMAIIPAFNEIDNLEKKPTNDELGLLHLHCEDRCKQEKLSLFSSEIDFEQNVVKIEYRSISSSGDEFEADIESCDMKCEKQL